jgi:hypothetical protein
MPNQTSRKQQKKASSRSVAKTPRSMPKGGEDPEGGLTAKGRAYFAKKQGSHLRPGVKKAVTPEELRRKGSFLTRTFTHPRGPMLNQKGEPTRLALSAHAWGEPVPKTKAAAQKLAAKGRKLLERYESASARKKSPSRAKKKNSLVNNINRRKRAGTSRSKKKSTVDKKAYREMEAGWPKKPSKARKK